MNTGTQSSCKRRVRQFLWDCQLAVSALAARWARRTSPIWWLSLFDIAIVLVLLASLLTYLPVLFTGPAITY
jgi:hypothetical protein